MPDQTNNQISAVEFWTKVAQHEQPGAVFDRLTRHFESELEVSAVWARVAQMQDPTHEALMKSILDEFIEEEKKPLAQIISKDFV